MRALTSGTTLTNPLSDPKNVVAIWHELNAVLGEDKINSYETIAAAVEFQTHAAQLTEINDHADRIESLCLECDERLPDKEPAKEYIDRISNPWRERVMNMLAACRPISQAGEFKFRELASELKATKRFLELRDVDIRELTKERDGLRFQNAMHQYQPIIAEPTEVTAREHERIVNTMQQETDDARIERDITHAQYCQSAETENELETELVALRAQLEQACEAIEALRVQFQRSSDSTERVTKDAAVSALREYGLGKPSGALFRIASKLSQSRINKIEKLEQLLREFELRNDRLRFGARDTLALKTAHAQLRLDHRAADTRIEQLTKRLGHETVKSGVAKRELLIVQVQLPVGATAYRDLEERYTKVHDLYQTEISHRIDTELAHADLKTRVEMLESNNDCLVATLEGVLGSRQLPMVFAGALPQVYRSVEKLNEKAHADLNNDEQRLGHMLEQIESAIAKFNASSKGAELAHVQPLLQQGLEIATQGMQKLSQHGTQLFQQLNHTLEQARDVASAKLRTVDDAAQTTITLLRDQPNQFREILEKAMGAVRGDCTTRLQIQFDEIKECCAAELMAARVAHRDSCYKASRTAFENRKLTIRNDELVRALGERDTQLAESKWRELAKHPRFSKIEPDEMFFYLPRRERRDNVQLHNMKLHALEWQVKSLKQDLARVEDKGKGCREKLEQAEMDKRNAIIKSEENSCTWGFQNSQPTTSATYIC